MFHVALRTQWNGRKIYFPDYDGEIKLYRTCARTHPRGTETNFTEFFFFPESHCRSLYNLAMLLLYCYF
jgi:hypothetical protein